jgi:alpha-galactosidase
LNSSTEIAVGNVTAPDYSRSGATAASRAVSVGGITCQLLGETGSFEAELSARQLGEALHEVTVRLRSAIQGPLPLVRLAFALPCIDAQAVWTPAAFRNKGLHQHFLKSFVSRANTHEPVCCIHSTSGENRLTFAASETGLAIELKAGADDLNNAVDCHVAIVDETREAVSSFDLTVRLDLRRVPYHVAIRDASAWWEHLLRPTGLPLPVSDAAFAPVYSTWYSFHLEMTQDQILRQCELAREYGCGTVIVDDGWEAPDTDGYGRAGDWTVARNKFPDLRSLVDQVHALDMKFMLWFATPFFGKRSPVYERFRPMLLPGQESAPFGIIDPRFAEVRDYLTRTIASRVREFGLDGVKIDFLDAITQQPNLADRTDGGRDMASLPLATGRLARQIADAVTRARPGVLIEFRQAYVGPRMRRCANLLRASDCALGTLENRIRCIDLRLTAGATSAVHGDMLTWHRDEPVEQAARQLLSVLFAVPQISVLLEKVPESHQQMLRFWLTWWRTHRQTLMQGDLIPLHPESNYPVVIASDSRKQIVVAYDEAPLPVNLFSEQEIYLINATHRTSLILEHDTSNPADRRVSVQDCRGRQTFDGSVTFRGPVSRVEIPSSGVARLRAC